MGKLVKQDPNDEPASKLLERIATEKEQLIKDKKIKKQKAISSLTEEINFDLPKTWEFSGIDQTFYVSGGIQKTPKRNPIKNHYPYLAVANVQRGKLELDDLKRFEVTSQELESYRLENSDLLVVEGNGSETEIGRCAIWQNEVENCLHQNHLIRCRPYQEELSQWVLLVLNSPFGMDVMKKLAVTSSGLYNLSVGKIRAITYPLPPLKEQTEIIKRVNALTELCCLLQNNIRQSSDLLVDISSVLTEIE